MRLPRCPPVESLAAVSQENGTMFGEGYLAVIALLTTVVGLGVAGYTESFAAWGTATWPVIFATGGAAFLVPLGLSATVGSAFFSVVAKSFAMTTLDSSMRFTRIAFSKKREQLRSSGIPQG